MSWSTAKSLCLALASSLALAGCNQLEAIETESGGGGVTKVPQPVREAFEASCGFAGCHAAGANVPVLAGPELDGILTATSLAGIPYVTLGDTRNSYIAIAMLADEVLGELQIERTIDRMPRGGPYVGENLETILAWIAGADFGGGVGTTGGATTGDTDSGGMTTGAPEPTFAKVQAIFDVKCSCHALPASMMTNGNLSWPAGMAWASIVGVKSPTVALDLIEPGDPAASYLYLKLTGDFMSVPGSAGTTMPQGGMLTADELTLIEEWITAGALEN